MSKASDALTQPASHLTSPSLISRFPLLEMSYSNSSSSKRCLSEEYPIPHKIFVWDPNGVYMDCSSSNPIYGHFLGPATLKGVHVRDLFPRAVSARLLKIITGAWKSGKKQFTKVPFERHGQRYEAAVVCSVTQEGAVMGFVTDRLVDVKTGDHWHPIPVVQNQGEPLMPLAGQLVTFRQYGIVQDLIAGCTNVEIAGHFGITERTVKSHLQKVYRKFNVVNRYGLMVRLLQAKN